MPKEIQLLLSPETAGEPDQLKAAVALEMGVSEQDIQLINPVKRSIDARSRQVKILLKADVYLNETIPDFPLPEFKANDVSNAKPVLIIGAGPAGMFAALRAIELGLKPVIIERGKDVRDRRRDLAALNKEHIVNPESNYCFGEGGAGTYSDGKLYTRSKKRGDVNKVLELLVAHGAPTEIRVEAHPHIGTNKLPGIIVAIRESILSAGGEIHFDTKLTDFIIKENRLQGIKTQNNDIFEANSVVLATGHSARDIFILLHQKGISIEAKPFALGVRVEHPQSLIDFIQYKCDDRGPYLPPAAYSLVQQVGNRGVYSFCMCPGGIIAPCATAPGEVVTNGWSPSKRNNPYANSGIVVSVEQKDVQQFSKHGPLAAMEFQRSVEQTCWKAGGETQAVPAQRLIDFVNNTTSSSLPDTSYQPGITSVHLKEVLPSFIYKSLREGFKSFGKKMRGYYTNEAVIHATESRTSSPVRIPRDRETLEHPQIEGLYPCGEGAGYAGGIVSAAIDGMKCVEKCAEKIDKQ
jgi:uncharacterized FAD-dependent dehydrogenase